MNHNLPIQKIIQESSQNKQNFLDELFESIEDSLDKNLKNLFLELEKDEIILDAKIQFDNYKEKYIAPQVKSFKYKTNKIFKVELSK
jgi:hypothetical protein